jgi:hypothetical protein
MYSSCISRSWCLSVHPYHIWDIGAITAIANYTILWMKLKNNEKLSPYVLHLRTH